SENRTDASEERAVPACAEFLAEETSAQALARDADVDQIAIARLRDSLEGVGQRGPAADSDRVQPWSVWNVRVDGASWAETGYIQQAGFNIGRLDLPRDVAGLLLHGKAGRVLGREYSCRGAVPLGQR